MAFNFFLGTATIPPTVPIDDVAIALMAAFDGFKFGDIEECGDYGELSRFVARLGPLEINLTGSDESTEHYYLKVSSMNEINPIELGPQVGSTFVCEFPFGLPVEDNGYINISEFVSHWVEERTHLHCNAAWR